MLLLAAYTLNNSECEKEREKKRWGGKRMGGRERKE